MSENVNPNQPLTLEVKLEYPLKDLARCLVVSNSTWGGVFTQVQ